MGSVQWGVRSGECSVGSEDLGVVFDSHFPLSTSHLPLPPLDPLIDSFTDALWLEDGLSKNTLAAYRQDLTLFNHWLNTLGKCLIGTTQDDINSYFSHQHEQTKVTTANRRLTVFKRFFGGCYVRA